MSEVEPQQRQFGTALLATQREASANRSQMTRQQSLPAVTDTDMAASATRHNKRVCDATYERE